MKAFNDLYVKQPRNVAPEVVKNLSKSEKEAVLSSTFSKTDKPADLDTLELYLKEKEASLEALNQKEMMESELAASKSQIENTIRTFDILLKCIKIATRIIAGDRVPRQDEQLLMEHYPDIYASAKILQEQNEDGKKHKSLADKVADPSEPAEPTDYSDLRTELTDSISQLESAITETAPSS